MKKKLLLLSTSLIYISPLSVISCTNNSLYDQSAVDAQQVFSYLKSGEITANIDPNIKINNIKDLENVNLIFTINKVANPSDTQTKFYEDLQKAINNVNGKIFGFYLPKLNEDLNSSIFIKFNNNNNLIFDFPIKKIQQNNASIAFANLSEQEIQTLVKDKLTNDKNLIINNLQNFFLANVVQQYLMTKESNPTLTFDVYWQTNEQQIIKNLTVALIRMYPYYFSDSYQNLFLSIQKPVEGTNFIKIPNILISTSDITLHPNCAASIGELTIYFK